MEEHKSESPEPHCAFYDSPVFLDYPDAASAFEPPPAVTWGAVTTVPVYEDFGDALKVQLTPGAGDCQYHALAQSLNAYEGCAKRALAQRCAALGLTLGTITAAALRQLAYCIVLLNKPANRGILEYWRNSGDNLALSTLLKSKSLDALSAADLRDLYRVCMRGQVTWGDELTLSFLEAYLDVWVDVFTADPTVLAARSPVLSSRVQHVPLVYVAMRLKHLHYETVVHAAALGEAYTTAWAVTELPAALVTAHRLKYSQADAPAFLSLPDAFLQAGWTFTTPAADLTDVLAALQVAKDVALAESSNMRLDFSFARPASPYVRAFPAEDDFCEDDTGSVDEDDLPDAADMFTAEGGWQEPCTVPQTCVARLQCGLRIVSNDEPSRAALNTLHVPFMAPVL